MAQILKTSKPTLLPFSSITPLNFDNSISRLPPSHIWPVSAIQNHPSEWIDVPTIDLTKPNLNQIRHACEEWGFFTIINHGVSEKLLEDLEMEIMELFNLPMEVKLRALRSQHETSGYGGVPVSNFSPNKMWHEGFGIQKEMHQHVIKLWPPHGNPKFWQVMEEYKMAMKRLAEKMLTLILASVELTPDDVNWAEAKTDGIPFGPNEYHFQLNSYPPCPDPDHAMGMTEHTDTSILTLLNQVNGVSGLQILHNDKWVYIKPTPGSFVVNCGDLTHLLFNGRFMSPVHRVVPNAADHRYSAAYFYGPPFETLLAPLSKVVGPTDPPLYPSFTWREYTNAKYKYHYSDKLFQFLRKERRTAIR